MNDDGEATRAVAAATDGRAARLARVVGFVEHTRAGLENRLIWQVWERMLEIEFVDRSVALAGKAFVSFFPLVIVVAAFMPSGIRTSIFTTLTHRLGIEGSALTTAQQAFSSADDIRRATGALGLVLTFFFASSFTAAIQRVYLRAWRRPPGGAFSAYTRGMTWLVTVLAYMAILGGLSRHIGNDALIGAYLIAALVMSTALWWFTAWFLLLGHVRWRVLLPTGMITGVALSLYALSASIWMPTVVTDNQAQFGLFGIALALTTWLSGAAICILVGACAGPVLAENTGRLGALIRGRDPEVLVADAPESLPAPARALRLRDAFRQAEEAPSALQPDPPERGRSPHPDR